MSAQPQWQTAPISPTCEKLASYAFKQRCGGPTICAYLNLSGGWMALCEECAVKYLPNIATDIEKLIADGERFEGCSDADVNRLLR